MKRAGRILYRLLSGLSLLLLVATAGVWVRSYWVSDWLVWSDWPQDRSFYDEKPIWCSRGGMLFSAWRYLSQEMQSIDGLHFHHVREAAKKYPVFSEGWSGPSSRNLRRYAALGFEWIPQSIVKWNPPDPAETVLKSFTLPLYFPCLLFAILPAHYVLRVRRRRRIARRLALGCCIACGYDLRASSGRCPECGNLASASRGPIRTADQ